MAGGTPIPTARVYDADGGFLIVNERDVPEWVARGYSATPPEPKRKRGRPRKNAEVRITPATDPDTAAADFDARGPGL